MTDKTIHNIHVSYDESHERIRNYIEYLKSDKRKDELKGYYEEAKQKTDGKIHINDQMNNEFTLICDTNHNCTLRLRGM